MSASTVRESLTPEPRAVEAPSTAADDALDAFQATPRVETSAYFEMLGRMIAAAGRRVAKGDPEDLAQLVALAAALDDAAAVGVAGIRASGRSWADVGRATGMTRQAAHERWSR